MKLPNFVGNEKRSFLFFKIKDTLGLDEFTFDAIIKAPFMINSTMAL